MIENIALVITLITYLLAASVYLTGLLFNRTKFEKLASIIAWIGVIANTVAIIDRIIQSGRLPLANLYEYGLLMAWCVMLGYLLLEFRTKISGLNAIVSFTAFLIILFISQQPAETTPLMPALRSNWLTIHVISAVIAYSAFAISFGSAILHLIKSSQTPAFQRVRSKLPDEQLLDQVTYKAIVIGLPFHTIMLVTGAVWAHYAWSAYWSWDPKETWSLITWLIYSAYLHARYVWGWKGKTSSYLSIIGFGVVIFTFIGVTYLLTGQHSYT